MAKSAVRGDASAIAGQCRGIPIRFYLLHMPNTATTSQAAEFIGELKEMASGKADAARLGEIAATAHRMDEAGQSVEACNVLGMVAALRGDTFEVERLFNAALQRGGNDAWTLGNYAAALNILVTGLHDRECERPYRQEWNGQEHHRPQFFDAMPGYFYTLLHRPDGSYAISLASDAIRDLYGLGPKATTNDYSELLALVHPDDAALRQCKLDESERGLSLFHVEYRIVLPQIGERWIEVHALPKRTDDGGTRWDGFINDITERKRMEDELRLKEFVLDQVRIGVYLIDEQARITYVNDAACRALGYSREELLTKTTMDINDDHSGEVYMAVHQKVLAEGACTFETRHVRRDGSLLPVEVWASRLEYRGNSIGVALAVDITERKRAEMELQRREREFRTLAESLPDNIVRYNRDGVTVYVNPVLELTLGDLAAAMIGTTPREYHPDGSYEDYARLLDAVLASGEAGELEKILPGPDGSATIHQIRMVPEYGANGEIAGVLALGRDITERKCMEVELAARVRDFRSLAENIPDNVARWDAAGRLLYSNPTHQRTLGKPFDEMLGKTLGEIFPDGYFAPFEEALARVVATGKEDYLQRVPARTPDGGMVIHDVRLAPEFDAKGRVVSVLGLGRDMTDIYRMQEAIAEREQEFRSLAESSPDFIVRYDRDGRHRYLNITLLRLLGLSSIDEVAGKRPGEIWPDGRFDQIEQAAARAVETGCNEVIEFLASAGSNEGSISQIFVVPERDVSRNIVGTIAFGRDISAIKGMQRQLTQFVANLPGFAYSFRMTPDGHGSFPFASPGIETLYGLKSADVKGDMAPLHALAHSDDAPRIIAAIAESARTMAPIHVEYRICRPGQPERWAEFRSSPVREADGSILWHGIMLDINERKRAEQALEDSRTQLRGLIARREEAREEERRYIAREIHDNLGQILSGLRLNVSRFARRYAANSAEMQAHLRDAGELVDLAVQEVRNISAALRPAELDMDIRSALSSHLERFGAYTSIACELHAGDDVDLTEEAHKLALFRIAQESLTNVARHARASKVEIALRMETPHCILCIRDNGVGFDTGANKPKSFGLVGMRERVAMLGGSVIINSSSGKGTEIVVRIPVKKIMGES